MIEVSNSKPRSWSQLTYLGRLSTYFDLTDNHSVELGTSMAIRLRCASPATPAAAIESSTVLI